MVYGMVSTKEETTFGYLGMFSGFEIADLMVMILGIARSSPSFMATQRVTLPPPKVT